MKALHIVKVVLIVVYKSIKVVKNYILFRSCYRLVKCFSVTGHIVVLRSELNRNKTIQ